MAQQTRRACVSAAFVYPLRVRALHRVGKQGRRREDALSCDPRLERTVPGPLGVRMLDPGACAPLSIGNRRDAIFNWQINRHMIRHQLGERKSEKRRNTYFLCSVNPAKNPVI